MAGANNFRFGQTFTLNPEIMILSMILLFISRMTFSLLPLVLCTSSAYSTESVKVSETTDTVAIAARVEKYVSENGFSGTVLIAREGKPVFHRAYGLAYIPAQIEITPDAHFSIASVTKLFTSIRVLQLAAENKLSLSSSLVSYLPEMNIPRDEEITIHHLLLHLSGLPDEKDKVYRSKQSPEEVVAFSMQNKPVSRLGDFHYNNIDYILLGLVIEKITGNTWESEIQTHILDILGMDQTGFLAHGRYPRDFAYTYSYGKRNRAVQDPFFYIENFYAAGCMYSTASDLLRLDQALYEGTLLGEESYRLLAKSYPEYNYAGYGVWNYRYPFVPSQPFVMERRGGILGANVVLVRLTDTGDTIIILSNDDRFNPDSFGDEKNLREALIRLIAG